MQDSLSGGFADTSTDAARAFRLVLDVMSRPGTIERLSGAAPPVPCSAAAGAVLLTLTDRTTPVHLAGTHDCPELREWLGFHTGAPLVGRDKAMFALGEWDALLPLGDYPRGVPEYPDRAATLIVEMPTLLPKGMRLRGPGIEGVAELSLPGQPSLYRANAAQFPLGLDFILTAGSDCAALPRSTEVEGH